MSVCYEQLLFSVPFNKYNSVSLETANRHLEQLDVLFSSDSCLAWRAEKYFNQKMNEQGGILGEDQEKGAVEQIE